VKKLLRKVSFCFLCIAALTVTAHLIIPHDHHSADSFLNQDKNCNDSGNESNHHSGFPVHCHAFNDLTSEKLRIYLVPENIKVNFLKVSILTDSSSIVFSYSFCPIREVFGTFHYSSFGRYSFFRGPPSIA